jgi:hypothetical protein
MGIHIYFNKGVSSNVAYFTADMNCLNILDNARVDQTPFESRKAIALPTVPY